MDTALRPGLLGHIQASYLLAKESLGLIRKDPEVTGFIVAAGLWGILIGAALGGGVFWASYTGLMYVHEGGSEPTRGFVFLATFGGLFALHFIGTSIMAYYGIALTAVVSARLEGRDGTYRDGIMVARARLGNIFRWAAMAATVGVVLNIIASQRSSLARGAAVAGGFAWNVATFLIIPILAREEIGVREALKRSGALFANTWGRTLTVRISLAAFFMIVIGVVAAAFGAAAYASAVAGNGSLTLGLAIGFVVVVSCLLVALKTLEAVLRVVLYEYALTRTIPSGFTPALIENAVARRVV